MNGDSIDVDEQQPARLPWGAVVSDGELIRQFAAYRDQGAFEELVGRHGPLVLGVCRRVLRHEQDVEDAFQATFLVLARRAAEVRWHSSLANWLYGVAYRTARKARSRRERSPETPLRNPEMIAADDPSREPRTTPSPESLRLLDEHLHGLPDRYRAPLVLCYLQGKTRDEAAEELGLSVGVVKGRLERGREKLRRRLTKAGLTLPAALPVLAGAVGECVAVPKSLAAATVDAALTFAKGHLAGAALTPQAITLAQGELTMLKTLTALKCLAAVLLVMGAVVVGVVAAFSDDSPQAEDRAVRVAQADRKPAEGKDITADRKSDGEDIQGTWKIVEAWSHARQTDKEELEKEAAAGIRLDITETAMTFMRHGDADGEATKYTLDPSQTPKAITFHNVENHGEWGLGIYELKGDTLRILYNDSNKDRTRRPAKLPAKGGPPNEEHRYLVLQRDDQTPAEETDATAGRKNEAQLTVATVSPVVVKTVPVAGTTGVSPDVTEIQVTFSKDMQDGSWSWSTAAGRDYFPETTGQPKYLQDRRTCVLPVTLEPGTTYAMWLNSQKFQNFKDADGRPAVPYLLVFQTGPGEE